MMRLASWTPMTDGHAQDCASGDAVVDLGEGERRKRVRGSNRTQDGTGEEQAVTTSHGYSCLRVSARSVLTRDAR